MTLVLIPGIFKGITGYIQTGLSTWTSAVSKVCLKGGFVIWGPEANREDVGNRVLGSQKKM